MIKLNVYQPPGTLEVLSTFYILIGFAGVPDRAILHVDTLESGTARIAFTLKQGQRGLCEKVDNRNQIR